MALSYAQGFVLIAISCMFAVSHAETVVVGGSENWRYGFNYTDWSLKHGPFYINDTLVFKYEPPHNVYLLPNLWSFIKCDFSRATLLANPTQGSGEGFMYVLSNWRVYYFASSADSDCKNGMMKFFAIPLPRRFP
ncbi:hypothetical protein RJ640_020307 [Escallonia rubra]|uniref:Phytocyanin domain-containing protein n=1 Tax=Escallonia rubra TaxID=112253 RepID=A0AA88RLU7_9ASTE|nr:hypothetical protein RJ640_020307 [Escallonia rubra]